MAVKKQESETPQEETPIEELKVKGRTFHIEDVVNYQGNSWVVKGIHDDKSLTISDVANVTTKNVKIADLDPE